MSDYHRVQLPGIDALGLKDFLPRAHDITLAPEGTSPALTRCLSSSHGPPSDHLATPGASASDDASCSGRYHKNTKAKRDRQEQGSVVIDSEDALAFYAHWSSGRPQTSGNGNSAGVTGLKIDIQKATAGFAVYFLHKHYLEALETDTVEAYHQRMKVLANRFAKQSPLTGSMLDGGRYERMCSHEGKSKSCTTHPGGPHSSDWRRCRQYQRMQIWQRNVARHARR
ncbi:hypothetical protein K470DRAFT_254461 [Piedraia hortae CBS 480.64]|uniref:Uncharacterized protein n=1 Tax=Piedraia hortae CBS 480.64 TaxID=1314780 RepID=A0A6A7CA40_9PEZI|nr:hypothetical protein K470DRAFT_254461 [Piedraia hortae CBS 480.64]